jgi:hypothetical protein
MALDGALMVGLSEPWWGTTKVGQNVSKAM